MDQMRSWKDMRDNEGVCGVEVMLRRLTGSLQLELNPSVLLNECVRVRPVLVCETPTLLKCCWRAQCSSILKSDQL